jgi:hypothetical protein
VTVFHTFHGEVEQYRTHWCDAEAALRPAAGGAGDMSFKTRGAKGQRIGGELKGVPMSSGSAGSLLHPPDVWPFMRPAARHADRWECERCKRVVKRAMNRPPQEADCRCARLLPERRWLLLGDAAGLPERPLAPPLRAAQGAGGPWGRVRRPAVPLAHPPEGLRRGIHQNPQPRPQAWGQGQGGQGQAGRPGPWPGGAHRGGQRPKRLGRAQRQQAAQGRRRCPAQPAARRPHH